MNLVFYKKINVNKNFAAGIYFIMFSKKKYIINKFYLDYRKKFMIY